MASDVMRVRLHLRQIRVRAVVVDTAEELRVRVESTVRPLPALRVQDRVMTPASARCATWRCRASCGCCAG